MSDMPVVEDSETDICGAGLLSDQVQEHSVLESELRGYGQ
jgi:hypothetical protein